MAHIALVILGFLFAVNASLTPNYPVNAQLPPVARVSQPYKFLFSQGTFGGSDEETHYSLSNAPSWIHVDSERRTLSGTPEKGDAGTVKFDLVASDGSESATMEITLVVAKEDGPKPGKPLLPQLEAIGATSAPSTYLIHSGDSFSLSFDNDTFINTQPSTVYYGTSPENAPLPSWVGFDQSGLRFSGTTPKIGPQTFTFNLVASDVAGFSAATMSFEMTVSPHVLSFNQSTQTLFVSRGKHFKSPEFAHTLHLDGWVPGSSDLSNVEADAPDWVTMDKESMSLSGTPPSDAKHQNVTISVTDKYQNVAKMIITLQYSQFFRDNIDDSDAVIGEYFTYVFDDSVLTNDSIQLTVDKGPNLSWLDYNPDNKTLYGQVPSDVNPGKTEVKLTAREGTAEDSRQFRINTVAGGSHTSDTDNTENSGGGIHRKKAGIIAISVVVPVAFLTSLGLLFCCWRRKRRASTHEEGDLPGEKPQPPHPDGPDMPHCRPFEDTTQSQSPELMLSPSPDSKPPKLELGPLWDSDTFDEPEPTKTRQNKGNIFSTSTIEWDFAPLRDPEPEEAKPAEEAPAQPKRLSFQSSPPIRRRTTTRREPLKPIQARRSLKRNSATSSRSKRQSKRSSGISSVASGLPVRFSGAGHGAGGFGPPGHGVVRASWQNTHASLQSDESSVGNLTPLFPRPPARASVEYPKRMSLRYVEPDSLTISESDSMEAFVHNRAKSRNSSNPLFSGQLSRRTSSGLRALERARSNASRADTVSSSIYDDNRRSLQERPWSTAMSASIYTDDNRQSNYLQSLMEESPSIKPLAVPGKEKSQSSLAQNYTNMITPLPRFFSELSLNKNGERNNIRHVSGEASNQLIDENQSPKSPHGGGQNNPYAAAMRKSPSDSSVPFDSKPRRVSLMRKESSHRGMQRDQTGSMSSAIAFV